MAVEADGAPMLTQITSGKSSNESSATWSPDGQLVAFASNRTPEPDSNTSSNIWVVSADNTDKGATLAQVTSSEGAGDSSPAWSPDGKWIAYVTTPNADAQGTAGSGYGTPHLALAPATGSGAHSLTLLTETLDRNVSGPFWVGTDRILFYVIDSGRDELASIRPDGTELTRLLQGEFSVRSVHMPRGDDAGAGVAVVSYPDAPSEVYTYELGGCGSVLGRKLTTVNDSWLSELSLGSVEKVAFPCKDTREYTHVGHRAIKKDQVNDHVEMFVHKPPGFIASKGFKYPTVLWIHGGPVSQYDWGFSAEQHLLAAAGFVVLSPNPRGSTGRGREFCEALFADWGGPALTDVLTGVDFAVAQGWSDPAKLCVGGWSYGGMLTNHVIVSDHRFKAAMTGASAVLYRASYGHDMYQLLWEQELGLPWEFPETWEEISPFNKVANVTTPTLIMCGEKDWNVPVQNSDQLYQALKRLGVPTTLVVYPEQHHWMAEPSAEADVYTRYLDWFRKYTAIRRPGKAWAGVIS